MGVAEAMTASVYVGSNTMALALMHRQTLMVRVVIKIAGIGSKPHTATAKLMNTKKVFFKLKSTDSRTARHHSAASAANI